MPFIIAIVIVIIAGVGFALTKSKQTTNQTIVEPGTQIRIEEAEVTNSEVIEDVDTENTEATTPPAVIPDGTHTTDVTYFTPKRDEYSLSVSLTTEKGIVTDATIVYSQGAENDPNPQRFDGVYREVVIGQKLEDISLSRVGGASLTTAAFNEAVNKILAENT